jgi:uncharacterized 2Fe-2S/4Fe-4S cluster protein (DUF4445 family)
MIPFVAAKETVQITFQPLGRKGRATRGSTILEAAREMGVGLSGVCGGLGYCASCRVEIPPESAAAVSPLTSAESEYLDQAELERGSRLACQTEILDNLWVLIPPESLTSSQRLQVEGRQTPVEFDPPVTSRDLSLPAANLEDLRSDTARLRSALGEGTHLGLAVLQSAPTILREHSWQVRAAIRDDELIAILPEGVAPLGLAVDLGTTKLAGYIVSLETGETLAAGGEMNPQLAYGEDVMARITYALQQEGGAQQLQQAAAEGIQSLAERVCHEVGRETAHIVEAVVAGNTAMHHLFLGLPTAPLGLAPYVPVESDPLDVRAREVGLALAPGAPVHLLPNIAGFVGADHVAALLAARMDEAQEPTLLLDIGTNTEICLAAGGRLLSCSTASGPAFEGAHIRFGMRAAPGAIERVRVIDQRIFVETIDHEPPIGICGSGILDAVAELRRVGILNQRGGMVDHPDVRKVEKDREFILVPAEESGLEREITVSRKDVSEIQVAKAAMATGWQTLLSEVGLEEQKVARVVVAGAFGNYIDIDHAVAIGMLPAIPLERFDQVGNIAGTGARMALISRAERERAAHIARQVEYVELTIHPDFQARFTQALAL